MNEAAVLRALSDREIAGCFNSSLGRRHRVRLIGGASEPLYLPALKGFTTIRYTHDHPASALHELAHWCIAGAARRKLVDYGYWYQPPPRSAGAQSEFARVEAPVQALEALFARACGLKFTVSVDDVGGTAAFEADFAAAVALQVGKLHERSPPGRARLLLAALADFRGSL